MPSLKKTINSPAAKLCFLLFALLVLFGYLKSFSVRASDEKINIYPQEFSYEIAASSSLLGQENISWRHGEKSLAMENEPLDSLAAFAENNSAVFSWNKATTAPEEIEEEGAAAEENSSPAEEEIKNPEGGTDAPKEDLPDESEALSGDEEKAESAEENSLPDREEEIKAEADSPAAENSGEGEALPADSADNDSGAESEPLSRADDFFGKVKNLSKILLGESVGLNSVLAQEAGESGEENIPPAVLGDEENSAPAENEGAAPAVKKEAPQSSLILSGFKFDPVLAESEITNVQLRLSLAARSDFSSDQVIVEYDLGAGYQPGGILFLNQESSNARNGGYFLYALPVFSAWPEIEKLKIKISYANSELESEAAAGKGALVYLDSAWLEVDYSGRVKGEEEKKDEQDLADEDYLQIDGKKIKFIYTDENSNENLIIKSDQENYAGLTESEVYLSVSNRGEKEEKIGLQAYFPSGLGDVSSLEKLNRAVIEEEREVWGTVYDFCSSGWSKMENAAGEYWCAEKEEKKACSFVSEDSQKCAHANVVIGRVPEKISKDFWENINLRPGKLADRRNVFAKLFGFGPDKKEVGGEFEAKKSTDAEKFLIKPGETQYFKMKISFPEKTAGEFYIETVGDQEGYGLLDPWWNASWDYQMPINITYSGAAKTDFQVSVIVNTAKLITAGKMKSDCSDMRFSDTAPYSSGQLSYYLTPGSCNKSVTRVWVKVPSLTANKTIYMYYGNSAAADASSGANTFVYFNDFETANPFTSGNLSVARSAKSAKFGSWGIQGQGGSSQSQAWINSSSMARDYIVEGWVEELSSSTKDALIGFTAGHTNGGANNIGYQAVINSRAGSASYLQVLKDFASSSPICNATTPALNNNTWYWLSFFWTTSNSNRLGAYVYSNSTTTTALSNCSSTDSTYSSGEYGVAAYQNGYWDNYRIRQYATNTPATATSTEVAITNHSPLDPFTLGQYISGTSTAITNNTWVYADNNVYLNSSSTDKDGNAIIMYYELISSSASFTTATSVPANFCSQSTAYSSCSSKIWANTSNTGWYNNDYPYRIKFIIQSSKVPATATNFPVYLNLANLGSTNGFWSHTKKNSDGGDLLVTNSSGTRMPLEVVAISTSTKTGELHFKADSLSSSANTEFYLYYGSSTASQPAVTDAYGARAVWSNSYLGVWHLKETSGAAVNSASSTADGTYEGTGMPSAVAAVLGNGQSFVGANSTDVDFTTLLNPAINGIANLTLSVWGKLDAVTSDEIVFAKATGFVTGAPILIFRDETGAVSGRTDTVKVLVSGSANVLEGATGLWNDTTTWHNVAFTFEGGSATGLKLYFDGSQDANTADMSAVSSITSNTNESVLGEAADGSNTFDGDMDELRISKVTRSSQWLATEYNNQKTPNTFYSTSSEQYYLTPSKKAINIPSVSDSAVGYKWQVIACDISNVCSSWVKFNDTIPNFKIDASAPTAPGALTFDSRGTNSITLNFGAQTSEVDFAEYRIYYKAGTSGVKITDSLFSSTSDPSLGSISFSGNGSTTISGLDSYTDYVFNIWAYDNYGRKASATAEFTAKTADTIVNASSLAQYKSDLTALPNTAYYNQNSVYLEATTTNISSTTLYFELVSTGSSFITATSQPASFCSNGTAYTSCSNKIWADVSYVSGWYDLDYKYRVKFTVQSSKVSDDATNFPVYLKLANLGSTNSFWSHTKKNSDGGDLLVTNSSGTRLPLEVVFVSTSTKTGELHFKADTLSSTTNAEFYLYYGSSTAAQPASSGTYGAQNVWPSSCKGIWHLQEDPGITTDGECGGGTYEICDSTNNNNDMDAEAGKTSADLITGIMGRASNFDNSDTDDFTRATPSGIGTPGNYTISSWFRYSGKTGYATIYNVNTYDPQFVMLNNIPSLYDSADITSGGSTTYTDNQWHRITYMRSGTTVSFYVDGTLHGTGSHTATLPTATRLRIGYSGGSGEAWSGDLDEVRYCEANLGSAWIITEYNNQKTPNTFYSTSSEQYYLIRGQNTISIPSITDSAAGLGYKWHVLNCGNSDNGCSEWENFNLTLPNFVIDTTKPTAPGALTLNSRKSTSIKLNLGTATTENNFAEYKIFYKAGTSGVTEANTAYTSSTNANMGAKNYNGASTVELTGLTPNTAYVFNIWAYDLAGNKASSTEATFQTSNTVTETYRYTSGISSGWTNSSYAWDGVDDTYAYRDIPGSSANDYSSYLQGTANNAPAGTLSILAVELGLEGYVNDPSTVNFKIKPLFSGVSEGATSTLAGTLFGYADTDGISYVDITQDSAAPADWTWTDIINLDAKVWAQNSSSSAVRAFADQIWLRVSVDGYPETVQNLKQYKADETTEISNGGWSKESAVVLKAEAKDPDELEILSVYFEFIPSSSTFNSSTTVPENACSTGTAYGSCTSKFWIAPYSGAPTDFSSIPFTGTSSIVSIPDGDYKWQVKSCDDDEVCSAWTPFNASAPNVRMDTSAPPAPGALTFNKRTSGSITLNFGASTTESNFAYYKIFYIKSSTTMPSINNTEHSDSNLLEVEFNHIATTTVSGLAKSSDYTFNIWAYDLAGNKTSSTVPLISSTTSGYILGQVSYIIENDDGATVDLNTAPGLAGVALTGVEKGQRVNVRVQIQNTGADQTYSKRYKMQYENNTDAPGLWYDLGAATDISYSYGYSGSNGAALTDRKAAVNANTWANGLWQEYTSLSNLYNLGINNFTEIAFMVQTKNATVNKSYRLRLIDSTGSSTLDSYTSYPTITMAATETKKYSKLSASSLTADNSDLTYFLDNIGYSNVATDDATRESLSASGNIPVYNFSTKFSNANWGLSASWNGQSSVAPSTNPVYLQVYRFGTTNAWVTVASNNSAAADTDFTLSGSVGYLMSEYYDGTYHAYWRVYQASGNEILRTDYYNLATTTLTSYVSQKHYRWRNDDGYTLYQKWYDNDYKYRKKITIDETLVTGSSDLTNFSALISFTDKNLRATSSSGNVETGRGYDIVFTLPGYNPTKLDHEIEKYSSTTGELVAWVEIPALSYNNDTELLIYYGNSTTTATQESAAGTWSNSYAMVHHLEEKSGTALDSLSAYNGTVTGTPYNGTGQVDGAYNLNGSTDYVNLTAGCIVSNTWTLEAWFNATARTDYSRLFLQGATDCTTRQVMAYWRSNQIMVRTDTTGTGGAANAATADLSASTWYHFVWTYNGSAHTLYINGATSASSTIAGDNMGVNGNNYIGSRAAGNLWNGLVDEVRLSSAVRSADWITTEYNNQNNQGIGSGKFLKSTSTQEAYSTFAPLALATWREAEDTGDPTVGTVLSKMNNIRLRMSFANTSGGTATGYNFKIQYASTSINCSTGLSDWRDVPSASATEHFEMSSSTYFAKNYLIGNELTNSEGYTFVDGYSVARPSSSAANISLAEDRYTEIEYDLRATNAARAGQTYCFRATKNGTALDAYDRYAELTIAGNPNTAPSFSADPSDNGSATSTPTTNGQNVSFTATASDAQTDQYYLAICKTDSVTAANGGAPTCGGGSWCISNRASSTVQASCSYTTDLSTETENWYAFVCDYRYGSGVSKCSASSQGTAGSSNASPFKINHYPTFTALSTTQDYKDPGGTFVITATGAETDVDGPDDTMYFYACRTNSASFGTGCTAGQTVCSSTAATPPNPSCSYTDTAPTVSGSNTYYGFVFDSHGLAATANSRSSSYTINNVSPSVGTLILNGGSPISLNIKGAADKDVQTVNTSVTDNNGCESIVSATGVIYLSSLKDGYNCTANNNNCYQISTGNCAKSACSGADDAIATFTCTASLKYYAIPTTDSTGNPWAADNWLSRLQVYDGSNYMATTSAGVELNANEALDITETVIPFGSLLPGENTGTDTKTINVYNIGNIPLDSNIAGSDMSGAAGGSIPVTYIEWDLTQNFSYTSGNDLTLAGANASLNLKRPTSSVDVYRPVYWNIGIPNGSNATNYEGTSTVTAILDSSIWE